MSSPHKSKYSDGIGQRIRQIRKEKGLSQKKFAERIGISQNYLSQIENDKFKPARPLLISIEYRFGVCEKWLLSSKGKKKEKFKRNNPKSKKGKGCV